MNQFLKFQKIEKICKIPTLRILNDSFGLSLKIRSDMIPNLHMYTLFGEIRSDNLRNSHPKFAKNKKTLGDQTSAY